MNAVLGILLTGVLVASACALIGNFLILRRMAMMSDAISHAILPGLVAGYFLAQGPNLLAGFLGAAVAAIVTVSLIALLQRTRRVEGDAAIGIVFPAMFALGTILVTKYFSNVHLDTDAILFGNIEFSPFDTLVIGGQRLGPQSIWVMGGLCIINLLFITVFYKELKLTTFDPGLAVTLGFSPVVMHYALMLLLSITSVGAFTAVGAVLVVALIIVPPATAYLLTDRLAVMIPLSVGIGALAAGLGTLAAFRIDSSIAGAMVTTAGLLFALALLFSPSRGLLAGARRAAYNKVQFAAETLVVHLLNHEATPEYQTESRIDHLEEGLRWPAKRISDAISGATRRGWIRQAGNQLELTGDGRAVAAQVMIR